RGIIDEPLIQIMRAQHKYREIISLCDVQLGTRMRNDNKFMYNYFKIIPHMRLGQIGEAIAAADQAIELAHSEGAKFVARAQRIAVRSWSGEHAKAIEDAEALPKDFPGPEFARRIKLTQATAYSEARDFAKAEKLLRIVVDADPN